MNTVLGWVMNTDGTVRASRVVRNGSTGASSSTPAATNYYVHGSIVALPQREAQQERDILQQQPLRAISNSLTVGTCDRFVGEPKNSRKRSNYLGIFP